MLVPNFQFDDNELTASSYYSIYLVARQQDDHTRRHFIARILSSFCVGSETTFKLDFDLAKAHEHLPWPCLSMTKVCTPRAFLCRDILAEQMLKPTTMGELDHHNQLRPCQT